MAKKKNNIIQIKDKSYINVALSPYNNFWTAIWLMVMPSINSIVNRIFTFIFMLPSQNLNHKGYKGGLHS